MKTSILLAVYAVVSFVSGLSYIFAPNQMMSNLGSTLTAGGVYNTQLAGAALISLAVLTWTTRRVGPSEVRNAILLSLLTLEALGLIISLITQLSGVFGFLGWGLVALFLFFTVALAYARFVKPDQE
jgi:hypothetical protein